MKNIKTCEICQAKYSEFTLRPELCPVCNDVIDEALADFPETDSDTGEKE